MGVERAQDGGSQKRASDPAARRAVRRFLLLLALGLFVIPLAVTPFLSRRLGVRVDEAPWLSQWTVEFSDWSLGRTVPHHIPGAPFVLLGAIPAAIFLSKLLRREFNRPALSGAILAVGAAPLLLQAVGLLWAFIALQSRTR
jgi:ABC-type spermidine/putrescine transport system permease subunit II